MLSSTLPFLRCVKRKKVKNPPKNGQKSDQKQSCGVELKLVAKDEFSKPSDQARSGVTSVTEVRSGYLECRDCQARYPILAGVAIVVDDPRDYVLMHVKGVSALVSDSEIPKDWLRDYQEAKSELAPEHIDEDLESKRVVALYLMNHYLRVGTGSEKNWWKSLTGETSPLIDQLVRDHWDRGPFFQIAEWVKKITEGKPGTAGSQKLRVVEFGCGVGGLGNDLRGSVETYLGLDSSFASIALGRHLLIGVPYKGEISIPEDLLAGPTARKLSFQAPAGFGEGLGEGGRGCTRDLIVADFEAPPLVPESWDLTLALNTIDMLETPESLPEMQRNFLRAGGTAIQSCPYIWHESVARKLRAKIPKDMRSSSRAVEWLYEKAGLKVQQSIEHLPWLFFKHVRQLEIYSVHLFQAEKVE